MTATAVEAEEDGEEEWQRGKKLRLPGRGTSKAYK